MSHKKDSRPKCVKMLFEDVYESCVNAQSNFTILNWIKNVQNIVDPDKQGPYWCPLFFKIHANSRNSARSCNPYKTSVICVGDKQCRLRSDAAERGV